jgi:cytochrome b
MSVFNGTVIEAGGGTPPATIQVWDPFVRVFHWSLVGLFATAYFTGDDIQQVHNAAGYTIAALLALRILWGFVGPRHARFRDFVRPPHKALAYLKNVLLLRRTRRYIGHNPAGGLMVIAVIGMLGATAVTGYMMTTDAYWGSEAMEELHEVLANATVALVLIHVLGVVVASFQHRENLVRAMVTGRKPAR